MCTEEKIVFGSAKLFLCVFELDIGLGTGVQFEVTVIVCLFIPVCHFCEFPARNVARANAQRRNEYI